MELSRKQFEILQEISDGKVYSQREIQSLVHMSLGCVHKIYTELVSLGYVSEGKISEAGLSALEPYRVKRAVFLAAGFGSRLVPITLNTPKPLVRVRGKRIIETLLDAVVAIGIQEIYVVRGYLAEQFDQLLYQYPMIKFVENPLYNEANNISSALQVSDLLSNAYVFESDLYLSNAKIVKKYQYSSNFLGIKKERTDDWCFDMKNGYISGLKVGGMNCYQEIGISYWNQEDGARLKKDIHRAYDNPGGKELYWEQVPLCEYRNDYKIEVRECASEDIIEIDTFNELKLFDSSYEY